MKKNQQLTISFITLYLSVFLLLLASACSTKTPAAEFTLQANDLATQFQENEAYANNLYHNKTLLVRGKFYGIRQLNNERIQLIIQSENGNIQCNLQEENMNDLPPLKINDSIQIQGICIGKISDVVLEFSEIIP